MHNFYDLNPHHQKELRDSLSSVSLDLNTPLNNESFYRLFDAYCLNPTEDSQNTLGIHLNNMNYLLGLFTDDDDSPTQVQDKLILSKGDSLKLLICSNDDREVFLPLFTDNNQVKLWSKEPIHTLSVPAAWIWNFVIRSNNYTGIVINPGSMGWCINLEQIQSLLDDIQ